MSKHFSSGFNPRQTLQVAKIGHVAIPPGGIAYRSESAKADKKIYLFQCFDIDQVYLDYCKNFEGQALSLVNKVMLQKGLNNEIHLQDQDGEIWQFFSLMFSAVIFGYTAIEAFVNKLIPEEDKLDINDYVKYPSLCKKHKNSDLLIPIKKPIREMPLEIKAFKFLPEYYQLNGKKLALFYANFKSLQKLRNMLIHLKDSEIRTGIDRDSFLWNQLIPRFKDKRLRFYPHDIASKLIQEIKDQRNRQLPTPAS